jgi:hypothetical protein
MPAPRKPTVANPCRRPMAHTVRGGGMADMRNALVNLFRRARGWRCGRCGGDFLCPMEWEPDGKERWAIEARCGACGTWHSLQLTNAQAAAWELGLDRQTRPIQKALNRLDQERMAREAEGFIAALGRDLIDAGDFA